jgi:hypothetical protein
MTIAEPITKESIIAKVDVAIVIVDGMEDRELGSQIRDGLLELRYSMYEDKPLGRVKSFMLARGVQFLVSGGQQRLEADAQAGFAKADLIHEKHDELTSLWEGFLKEILSDAVAYANGQNHRRAVGGR